MLASPPKNGTTTARLTQVPRRNEFFTGREDILVTLHWHLQSGGKTAARQAICGLGGVGKTHLATEYAHRHTGAYSFILWADAESAAGLESSFVRLAPKLGLSSKLSSPEVVTDVRCWLANNSGWLLILDGVNAPEILQEFLLGELPGSVLITSRAQNLGALGIASPIVLDTFPLSEAIAFLKKRTQRSTLPLDEERAARTLADKFGRLPLALEQAAAYLYSTGATFQQYETLYQTRRTEILKRAPNAEQSIAAIAKTWRRNVAQTEAEFPAAGDLLRLSAFLAPDAIPLELIEASASEISPAVSQAAAEALTINEIVAPLLRFSLIWIAATDRLYSLHRLLQDAIKDEMDQPTQRSWAEKAVCALNSAFPEVEFQNWNLCARLLPHALVAAKLIDSFGLENEEAAQLLNQAGYFLTEHGRYAEAEPLHRKALVIRERTLGPEVAETADSLNNLGFLCKMRGKYVESESLYRKALIIRERTLGAKHPETANTVNNLAELFQTQEKYAETETLYQRALAIREQTLGMEHPAVAQSLNNLAGFHEAQGNFLEADSLYRRSLTIRERRLGTEHPDIANSLNNLASFHDAHGNALEAETLYRRALSIRERTLGAEHPLTATILNNLAMLYAGQGKRADAATLFRRALDIAQKTLGAEHPHAQAFAQNLTVLMKAKRRAN